MIKNHYELNPLQDQVCSCLQAQIYGANKFVDKYSFKNILVLVLHSLLGHD